MQGTPYNPYRSGSDYFNEYGRVYKPRQKKVGAGSHIVPLERCLKYNNKWKDGVKVVEGKEGDAILLQCTSTTIVLDKKQLEIEVNSDTYFPEPETPACLRSSFT